MKKNKTGPGGSEGHASLHVPLAKNKIVGIERIILVTNQSGFVSVVLEYFGERCLVRR